MSTLADYNGRTVDAAILRPRSPATDGVDVVSDLSMGQDGGAVCTGVQKLAQKWLVILLTQQGSVPRRPTRGTSFPAAIVNGTIRTDADLATAFLIASDQVAEQLAADVTINTPTDEQLDSATLLSASITLGGAAVLRVYLLSKAGTSRNVVFPIGVSP